MDAWDRTVVVRPEQEATTFAALDGAIPGLRIITNRWIPEGTAYIIDDEAMEKITREWMMESFTPWTTYPPTKIVGLGSTA